MKTILSIAVLAAVVAGCSSAPEPEDAAKLREQAQSNSPMKAPETPPPPPGG